jgi:hypothetical protein
MQSYDEAGIMLTLRILVLVVTSVFALLYLALISYHAVDRMVGVSMSIAFTFFFILIVQFMVPRNMEKQFLLVLAYTAVVASSLSGFLQGN